MPRSDVRFHFAHAHRHARGGRHPQPVTSVDRRLQRQRTQRHVRQHPVGRRQHAVPGVSRTAEGDDPRELAQHGGRDRRAARARVFHVDRRLRDGLVVVLPPGVHRERRLRRAGLQGSAIEEHPKHTRVTDGWPSGSDVDCYCGGSFKNI